ncbi:MAG: 2OG-Fe(II) oxygenase [Flavobacteriaceae bacterium]|nr:2OG-Fe(II) oxygenase [Flavobacteriaceae bacterium]
MNIFTDDEWVSWFDTLSNKDYVVIDNFLPTALYSRIRHFFENKLKEDAFRKSAIGSLFNEQIIEGVRGDYIYWLDKNKDTDLEFLFKLLDETKNMLNRYCYLSLSDYEFHLAHYPSGSFYKRHLDRFNNRSNRMITMILYMNEQWQEENGGQLKIYTTDTSELVAPLSNRCILFRSDALEHEVLLTRADRYSLTGWFLYQPAGLGYMLTNS